MKYAAFLTLWLASGPAFGQSSIVSDDFSAASLDTNVWTYVDPVGDTTLSLQGFASEDAQLVISLPGGVNHDLWTNRNDAPRLLQSANNTDFEVEVKFDTEVENQYQSQGIVVQESMDNLLRFELLARTQGSYFFAARVGDASSSVLENTLIAGAPDRVRVTRTGDEWCASYSSDGVVWSTCASFTYALEVTQVGVHATNFGSGGPAPAFTSAVDYFFNTAAPIEDEDGTDNPLSAAEILRLAAEDVHNAPFSSFKVWYLRYIIRWELYRTAHNIECGAIGLADWRLRRLQRIMDGCTLRGTPDPFVWYAEFRPDWIIECGLQMNLYDALTSARELID